MPAVSILFMQPAITELENFYVCGDDYKKFWLNKLMTIVPVDRCQFFVEAVVGRGRSSVKAVVGTSQSFVEAVVGVHQPSVKAAEAEVLLVQIWLLHRVLHVSRSYNEVDRHQAASCIINVAQLSSDKNWKGNTR